MAGDTITPFNPSTLKDKLEERLRSSLADLIPPEAWDQYIKTYLDDFFKPRTEYGQLRPSKFQQIVDRVLEETARQYLKEFLSGPEWQRRWDGAGKDVGIAVAKVLNDNASAIFANILQGTFAGMISEARNRL